MTDSTTITPTTTITTTTLSSETLAEPKVDDTKSKAIVESCDDDDCDGCGGDEDTYIDDATILAEPKIECVDPAAPPSATQEQKTDQSEDKTRTRIHFIKNGKLSYFTFVESALMKNNTPPEADPNAKETPSTTSATSATSLSPEEVAKITSVNVDHLKKTTIAQEFVRAANLCGERLRLLAEETTQNLLVQVDKDITNAILERRTQRKTRQPNLKEEPLLIARTFSLPPSTEFPLGDNWSSIEISDARNPRNAKLFETDIIEKYDVLEPNNSGMRLLIVETAMNSAQIEARVRLYCFFSVKWKYDKQNEKFLNTRNGKKKGAPKDKPDTAIVGPINVEQGGTQYLDPDAILVLATFWACQPIERRREEFINKFLGKQKAALKAALAKEDAEGIFEDDVDVKTGEKKENATPAAPAPPPVATEENSEKKTDAIIEKAAEAAAATNKKEDELSDDIKAEIKALSDHYKAKCMSIEVCVADYCRRRLEARRAAIKHRVSLMISFVLMSYGADLCVRHLIASPNIPEPLAFIVVSQQNGSIVNMDETTCVDESTLATYMKTEPRESPTMRMYIELMAALKSKNFNPRHQVIVHIMERGQYQDRGQNIRITVFADFDFEQTSKFVNLQLTKHASPGEPKTVEELAERRLRKIIEDKKHAAQKPSSPAS